MQEKILVHSPNATPPYIDYLAETDLIIERGHNGIIKRSDGSRPKKYILRLYLPESLFPFIQINQKVSIKTIDYSYIIPVHSFRMIGANREWIVDLSTQYRFP